MSSIVFRRSIVIDHRNSGRYKIAGNVYNTGTPNTPVRRRVRLVDQSTGYFLRETWSDSETGAYSFENIANRKCVVYAIDHTGSYGGVIETDIQPEPM